MSETPSPKGKKVTKGKVVRRKKKQSVMSDSFDTALSHAASEILIPSAKEIFLDMVNTIVSTLLYPDGGGAPARSSRRKNTVISSGGTYTNYSRIAAAPRAIPSRKTLSPDSRSVDEWGEIIFQSRGEAKAVLDSMYNILNDYEVVTISDLLNAVGERPSHTDVKWGWDDLRGTTIDRVRGGFVLALPDPIHVG